MKNKNSRNINKKNRPGQSFNDMTAEVMEILSQGRGKIQKNIKIDGPDGSREIDVLYEEENGLGRTVRTVIECKDYGKKS